MPGGVPKALRSMSADQIAKRCEELGARIEIRGAKWWVFPPDPDLPPISFSRLAGHMSGNGTAQANLLSDLRKRGLDLLAGSRDALKPSTTDRGTEETPMPDVASVNGYTQHGTAKPFDYRKAYADLKDQVATLVEQLETYVHTDDADARKIGERIAKLDQATVAMLAEQEGRITDNAREQDRRLRAMAARLDKLEQLIATGQLVPANGAKVAPPVPSKAVRLRDAVLAFYREYPGLKFSPMAVKANLEEDRQMADMLTTMAPTAVAGACRDLMLSGDLMGGGKAGGKPGGPLAGNHGVYWAPKKTEDKEAADA
jgi:hypothetical protein